MTQFVQLPVEVFNAVINHVAKSPYAEVAQLMGAVQQNAKSVNVPDPVESAKAVVEDIKADVTALRDAGRAVASGK